MDSRAKLTSKGQVTVPKRVREALQLEPGDEIVFRVERARAIMARTGDFLEMAGSVDVPAAKKGTPWTKVLEQTRRERAKRRR